MASDSTEEVLCRFLLDGRKFYFKSLWGATHFEIQVSDGRHGWKGEASEKYIEETLKPKEMAMEEYMKLTRKALTAQDLTKKHFSYKLSQVKEQPDLQLTWRIKLAQDSDVALSVKGVLPLSRLESGHVMIQQSFDLLIDRQSVLEKQNGDLKENNDVLRKQRGDALSQLNTLVEEKKALELDLYQKFVDILNEKKKKIRELKKQERRPEKSSGNSTPAPTKVITKVESPKGKSDPPSSQENEAPSKPINIETPKKGTFSLTGPTPSLSLLDDEKQYNITTTIRKRHRPPQDRKTTTAAAAAATTAKKLAVPPPTKKLKTAPSTTLAPKQKPKAAAAEEEETPLVDKRKERRKSNLDAEDLLDMIQ